jgi:cell division protein FtsW (lipid II flippase)
LTFFPSESRLAWLLTRLRDVLRGHGGWIVLAAALLLSGVGVLAIGTVRPGAASLQGQRWLPIGLLAMGLCLLPRPRLLGEMAYPLLAVALAMLLYVVIPGAPRVPRINGATAWIDLGLMRFQPSEFGKVAFVLALAWYLRYRENHRTLRGLIPPFLFMAAPVLLILKEPDLGSALLFAPTLMVMLLAAGARLWHIGAVAVAGMAVLVLVVAAIVIDPPHLRTDGQGKLPDATHVLASHQEKRIAALIWPDHYEDREAYQQIVATRLIGAGGSIGTGGRAGLLIEHNHLPEPHNDMIYAVIAHRWGALGGLGVLMLYVMLVGSMLVVAARSSDPFARLACVGFAGMIFSQAAINIGMTIGLLPVTGITLPLISYGGSSLLFTFVMIGLTLNFASRRPRRFRRPSFEFDKPAGRAAAA